MEIRTRFTVDTAHCRRAGDELYAMLRRQGDNFVDRYYASKFVRWVPVILAAVGAVLSLLGLAICVYIVATLPCCRTQRAEFWVIPVFAALFVVFSVILRLRTRVIAWAHRNAEKRARRYADKLIKVAVALAPYEAEFDLRGDLLTYWRGKDGQWQMAWRRHLAKYRNRGVVIRGSSTMAVFKKTTSLFPAIVILTDDGEPFANQFTDAVRQLGVSVIASDAAMPLEGLTK